MNAIYWRMGASCLAGLLLLFSAPASFARTEHARTAHNICEHLPGRQVGRAMFYGPGFDGRVMANGQIFDMNALTASSRTLPLGTRARVTNLRSGRSTIVTITDRGSFHAKHVIVDLSVGAARDIGLTEREGVAPVAIKPISCTRVARLAAAPSTRERLENIARQ